MKEHLLLAVPGRILLLGLWRPRIGLLTLAACLPFFGTPPAGSCLLALDLAGFSAILDDVETQGELTIGLPGTD